MDNERLKILCDLVVDLVEIRQRGCAHLCVENIAPEIFNRLAPIIMPELPLRTTVNDGKKRVAPAMTYQELIEIGKKIFGFSPNDEFESAGQVLEAGRKCLRHRSYYSQAAETYSGYLSRYADEAQRKL